MKQSLNSLKCVQSGKLKTHLIVYVNIVSPNTRLGISFSPSSDSILSPFSDFGAHLPNLIFSLLVPDLSAAHQQAQFFGQPTIGSELP